MKLPMGYVLTASSRWCHAHRWWWKAGRKFIGHPYNYETRLRHWPWWKFKLHICPAGTSTQAGWHLWFYCRRGGLCYGIYHPTRWRHLQVRG